MESISLRLRCDLLFVYRELEFARLKLRIWVAIIRGFPKKSKNCEVMQVFSGIDLRRFRKWLVADLTDAKDPWEQCLGWLFIEPDWESVSILSDKGC